LVLRTGVEVESPADLTRERPLAERGVLDHLAAKNKWDVGANYGALLFESSHRKGSFPGS